MMLRKSYEEWSSIIEAPATVDIQKIIRSAAVNEFRLILHYIEEKVHGQRKIVSFIVHGKKSDIECFQLRLVILNEKNWDVSRLR